WWTSPARGSATATPSVPAGSAPAPMRWTRRARSPGGTSRGTPATCRTCRQPPPRPSGSPRLRPPRELPWLPVSLAADDRRYLWHPFTQQQGWEQEEPLIVERAEGTDLIDTDGRRFIDGVSSLWCNVHGHRHPRIDKAVTAQLDSVAHSTMLGLSHPPAIELARRLVELAPPGLARVFYSDSGSTAAEIALKMAFQYWQQRGGADSRKTRFVCLREAYHGDTIGSVSVGGIDLFHAAYRPLLFNSLKAEPGDAADLERLLADHG